MTNDPTPGQLEQLAKRLVNRAFAEQRPDRRKVSMLIAAAGVLTGIATALLVMSVLAGHPLALVPLAIEIVSIGGAAICLTRYRTVRRRLHNRITARLQELKPKEVS
jgi:hypothetical protein